MTDINPIRGPAPSATLREYANQTLPRKREAGGEAVVNDSLELSELAGFLGRLAELPEARARKIVEIRAAIAGGTYDTPDKLDLAVERMCNEVEAELRETPDQEPMKT